jgi:hypothetical protein
MGAGQTPNAIRLVSWPWAILTIAKVCQDCRTPSPPRFCSRGLLPLAQPDRSPKGARESLNWMCSPRPLGERVASVASRARGQAKAMTGSNYRSRCFAALSITGLPSSSE